jgi:hypothetical protein
MEMMSASHSSTAQSIAYTNRYVSVYTKILADYQVWRKTHICNAGHEFIVDHLSSTDLADIDLGRGRCLEEETCDVRAVPIRILPHVGLVDKRLALSAVDASKFLTPTDLFICVVRSGVQNGDANLFVYREIRRTDALV